MKSNNAFNDVPLEYLISLRWSPRLFFLPSEGGAYGLWVSALGALEAQRTEGPPASAVLQADAMPVGLDAEVDRCQLKSNHITWHEGQKEKKTRWLLDFILINFLLCVEKGKGHFLKDPSLIIIYSKEFFFKCLFFQNWFNIVLIVNVCFK